MGKAARRRWYQQMRNDGDWIAKGKTKMGNASCRAMKRWRREHRINSTYKTYGILIENVGFIEVVANSRQAAIADVEEAYYNPNVLQINEYNWR